MEPVDTVEDLSGPAPGPAAATAPPDAAKPPGGTAGAQFANGTHQAPVEGATWPAGYTEPSRIDAVELVSVALDANGMAHAYAYRWRDDSRADAVTLCGADCTDWEPWVGARPTCGPCALAWVLLTTPRPEAPAPEDEYAGVQDAEEGNYFDGP